MRIGYARVSKKDDQDVRSQVEALQKAECERIYYEEASGGRWDRPELHKLLDQLRPADVVMVWKLDRLSRSLKDLIAILERLEKAGAKFQSLTEHVETVSPAGRMLMQMLGSFAEFERAMIRERTKRGLEYARSQGRNGGRKPKLSPFPGSHYPEAGRVRREKRRGSGKAFWRQQGDGVEASFETEGEIETKCRFSCKLS